jgi:hypothetical protein
VGEVGTNSAVEEHRLLEMLIDNLTLVMEKLIVERTNASILTFPQHLEQGYTVCPFVSKVWKSLGYGI